ncbi:MAG: multi-sensor hybrid histidine kinase [Bryobacterales bacterium]|nr:multi-sensor hybrid histidine kinase [Bryobacterales bacterium]
MDFRDFRHCRKAMATILIVDDNDTNREMLTDVLGYRQHKTVEARDGAEALQRTRDILPDLIITDILMPTMDGYELTRRLREDAALAVIPVIFYSAHYMTHEASALAAKCGVQYIIEKPVDAEALLHTVDAALGLTQAEGGKAPNGDFDNERIRVLTDKVSQQADAMGNLAARLEALIDIGRDINVAQNPSYLIEKYCSAGREMIGARCAAACVTDGNGPVVRRFCSIGVAPANEGDPCPACGLGAPVAEVLQDRASWRGSAEIRPASPYLVVPVMARTRTYGWLGFANKIGHTSFSGEDERLVGTLAAQLAVGYETSRLFEELKRRNEELEHEVAERKQSAEKYRMVLEQASDGIAIADATYRYVEVNAQMLEMLGYTREQFLQLSMPDLIPKQDEAKDAFAFDLVQGGEVLRRERRFIRHDGSILEVEISLRRMEDGRTQEIVRDVTDRKRLEAQLRQSQKLEAVGRLAGGVAHDFNNLLTVILGHSDLTLSSMDADDRRRHDIEDIREAGARAAVLTSQLLAFSRKQVLQPKIVDISIAVSNLTKMLGRLISSNIEIVTRLERDLWRTKVDPGQLDQVILNLTINARDAMPLGGKLTLATNNCRLDDEHFSEDAAVPPGDYVLLEVSDPGCGMDAETRSHLFEPFFTTKLPGKGTGLGLSTVYGIIRQSGGHISVDSELGKGTSVKVYLPRAREASESVRHAKQSEQMPRGNETILLAEDEQRVRGVTSTVLARLGYKVLEAGDGQEALEVAKEYAGEIHLLLTDIMMPKMSGRELAEQLGRDRPAIKVLLSSGYSDDAISQVTLDASTPFLQKPFTPRSLSIKIREVLDGGSEQASPEGIGGAHTSRTDDLGIQRPS